MPREHITLTTNSRARSVYGHETEASEFIEWLNKRWSEVPDESKPGAKMECRLMPEGAMVGIVWCGPCLK